MNKIFKLALTLNKEDQQVAKILLMKQPKLRKHFYNIAQYLLTRRSLGSDRFTPQEFNKYESRGQSGMKLFAACTGVLGKTLKDKVHKRYSARVQRVGWKNVTDAKGVYYTAAKRSLKYLEENE